LARSGLLILGRHALSEFAGDVGPKDPGLDELTEHDRRIRDVGDIGLGAPGLGLRLEPSDLLGRADVVADQVDLRVLGLERFFHSLDAAGE